MNLFGEFSPLCAMAPPAAPGTTPLNFAQEVGELCSDKTIATLTPKIDEKTSQNMLLWYLCTTKTKHFFCWSGLASEKKNDSLPQCSQPLCGISINTISGDIFHASPVFKKKPSTYNIGPTYLSNKSCFQ